MTVHPRSVLTSDASHRNLSDLNNLIAGLGYEIVDVSGFLDAVHQTADLQLSTLDEAQKALKSLDSARSAVVETTSAVAASNRNALEIVETSVAEMRTTAKRSQTVSSWVAEFDRKITSVQDSLQAVFKANKTITSIAKHVDILAINATIEASRAGDAGRGFAVIANAIKELSQNTAIAASDVAKQITELSETVETLKDEAKDVSKEAADVIERTVKADAGLSQIAQSIRNAADGTDTISQQALKVDAASEKFGPAFVEMATLTKETAEGVTLATERTSTLIDRSETIVQKVAMLGGSSVDSPFIDYVQQVASQIADVWSDCIARGEITLDQLFDQTYTPIQSVGPQQFMTPFTDFTDKTLTPIQEAALDFDPKVVFCAAVDTEGYLPTHNKKFSHPPSDDPVWNASHCRNRRIFNDRVGLKAGCNTRPFLLQVYRRDMGGGVFAMMKDLSAPITVKGRHWGGLRMAYTFE